MACAWFQHKWCPWRCLPVAGVVNVRALMRADLQFRIFLCRDFRPRGNGPMIRYHVIDEIQCCRRHLGRSFDH
jgi:hypothetical protein